MAVWHIRIACWIPKAKDTHSEYAILIDFLLQQWLHERACMLRCMYIDCLICYHTIQYTYRTPEQYKHKFNIHGSVHRSMIQ
jgi:hypothetical protein